MNDFGSYKSNQTNACVSIVIPAYNHCEYLSESISSVLDQDYSNIELIVLNDGSTDATEDVLKGFSDEFYWETQDNIGQANTLNKGWNIAKGEILSYLSADDVLEKCAVRSSIEQLNKYQTMIMTYCDFNIINENSNIIKVSRRPEYNFYEILVNQNCMPGPGVFFKRSAYKKAGPWNPKFIQMPDYEFWLRLGLTGDFLHIPKVLASFRIHDESQTFSIPSVEKAGEPISIISSFFKLSSIPPKIKLFKNNALSNAYIFSAQMHLKAGRYNYAFCNIWESIKLNPLNSIKFKSFYMLLHGLLSRPKHILYRKISNTLKLRH